MNLLFPSTYHCAAPVASTLRPDEIELLLESAAAFRFPWKTARDRRAPDPLCLAFPGNPIHLPAGQLTIAPTSPTLRFRLAKTQIGIYMQVHGSAEARTHIIIDYNRNGIVNQIALNGSDFKMGFIIAGAPTAYSLPVPPHPGRGFDSTRIRNRNRA